MSSAEGDEDQAEVDDSDVDYSDIESDDEQHEQDLENCSEEDVLATVDAERASAPVMALPILKTPNA